MIFFRHSLLLLTLLLTNGVVNATGDKLTGLFPEGSSSGTDEILDPEHAFKVDIIEYAQNQLLLSWQVEPGYYLYKDKLAVQATGQMVNIDHIVLPPGTPKDDLLFGRVEVYYGQDHALVPFTLSNHDLKTAEFELSYQGCKENTVCYPPIKKSLSVTLGKTLVSAAVAATEASSRQLSEQDAITRKLKEGKLLLNMLAFFGFGFLLGFTPCIFPMIPILSGIIVGEGRRITRVRAFFLSLSYVLAMAFCYAVLGIITGLFGFNLQAAFQTAWVLVLFSGIFVLLALSMFGFYKLQLPSSWQSRLSPGEETRGTLRGAAALGVLSAVIVGPCITPPLAAALLYISRTGDALLGGLSLFSMGLGFGVLLLFAGITTGELLPRAGAWMNTVQRIFGIIMLAVAIWFLERVLPEPVTLLLWAALFIITATFMGALDRLGAEARHWQRLWKGVGVVLAVYGVILIVAAATGSGTVTRPFNQPLLSSGNGAEQTLPFRYVADTEALQMQLAAAKAKGQPVMLDFYADWCITCNELERYTFSDPVVRAALREVVLLKADVTENNVSDQALLRQFDLFGPPAVLFFDANAVEIKSHRLIKFVTPEQFVPHVRQALAL